MIFSTLINKFNFFFGAACSQDQKDALYNQNFFFFDPWWKYLDSQKDALGNCVPKVDFIGSPSDFWLIGLAILDMLLRLAGFVAIISLIIAGIELIRSEGSPEKATNARQRLINSLIGLAIAASATAIVAFIGAQVGGSGAGLPQADPNQAAINKVMNIIFVIVGALAFLFIVLAGLRMITAGDNPTKIAEARRQIIYAALGLVLVAMSAAIVNFVLGRLG